MGNTASTDRGGGGPNRHANNRNQTLIVKPPTDWNVHSEAQKFIVVSPQSDISNPSQIRHPLHRSKANTMTSKTPMRRRASKVVAKGGPTPAMQHNCTTDLPEPESFYFDPAKNHSDPSSLPPSDSQEQVMLDTDDAGKRNLHETIKAKATRARRILKGCWKEQKENFEGCYRENTAVEHERFQSMSPVKLKRSNVLRNNNDMPPFGKAKGPQFIPDIEEDDEEGMYDHHTMSPRQVYLHDEESYLKRMQAEHQVSATPLMVKESGNICSDLYPLENNSILEGGDSPVVKLFDRRVYSDSGLLDEAKQAPRNKETTTRNSCPEHVQQQTPAVLNQDPNRKPNTVERDIQKQVDEQIQLQFESKSEEIGRVKRLRETYLQRLESTKRLSQEEDTRRQSIETKMEQMRKKVIAEEFEQYDGERLATGTKEPDSPFDEPKEEARPKPFDEEKENILERGRKSVPVHRSTNAAVSLKPLRKSEPILSQKPTTQRPSNVSTTTVNSHFPVLLKIAGWEEATKKNNSHSTQPQSKQMPAVLQLAGWKEAANEKKQPDGRLTGTSLAGENLVSVPSFRESEAYKLNTQHQERAINQAAFNNDDDISEEENRIPMPYDLHHDVPKETPVVQKMSRMLLQTNTFTPIVFKGTNQYGRPLVASNLDDSMDSAATPLNEVPGKPLVTKDALVNAAFLFSPSYVDNDASLLRLGDTKSEASTTISTMDSRNRLLPNYSSAISTEEASAKESQGSASLFAKSLTTKHSGDYKKSSVSTTSKQTETYLQPLLKSTASVVSRSTDSGDRHVRFSIGNKVIVSSAKKNPRPSDESSTVRSPLRSNNLEVPAIEHKLSDLTDIFSRRSSIVSLDSHKHGAILTKESIDEMPESNNETPTAKDSEAVEREPSPPSNWSYSIDMDNGVTPLRSGKGGIRSNATNSPHKRFNEAKNRFSTTKVSPAKKRSPVKPKATRARHSGGFVHARVAAMESKTSNANVPQQKSRRDTIGHKVIAPRRAVLKSPHFKRTTAEIEQVKSTESDTSDSIVSRQTVRKTSTTIAQQRVKSMPLKRYSNSTSSWTDGYRADNAKSLDDDDDSDSDSDVFGAIRLATTTDEEDVAETGNLMKNLVRAHLRTTNVSHASASTNEVEEDDFAAILQYQDSIDEEEDDDDSTTEETVATIQRTRTSTGSSTVMSGSTVATVVRRRLSVAENSTMTGDTAPTVVRRSSVVSGSSAPTSARSGLVEQVQRSSYPPRSKLPFRDEAMVRPTEQSHRAAPGALVLSPMQRTPMQAMKWRALAAAEKEKTERSRGNGRPLRKSLSERNPNVIGHF